MDYYLMHTFFISNHIDLINRLINNLLLLYKTLVKILFKTSIKTKKTY